MCGVAVLGVRTNPMAEVLTVSSPRLHLARELIEQRRVASDEADVEHASRGGPRAARLDVCFGEGADERFNADGLLPERVADDLGDGLCGKIAGVKEQQLGLCMRRLPEATLG